MNRADEFLVSVFKDSTTASTLTQRLIRSLKAPNKPSLDTLFSNTWLLEEKNGKNKLISHVSVHSVLFYKSFARKSRYPESVCTWYTRKRRFKHSQSSTRCDHSAFKDMTLSQIGPFIFTVWEMDIICFCDVWPRWKGQVQVHTVLMDWMHDIQHITSQPKLTLTYNLLGQQTQCDGQKLLLC